VLAVLLRQEAGDGVDVLAVSGPVAEADARVLVDAVTAARERRRRGIVLDLLGVTTVEPRAVDALRGLATHSGWPTVTVRLCSAPAEVEDALADVAVDPTRRDALAALEDRSPQCRVVPIEHSPRGPGQARRVVADCADRLGLAEVGDDLVLLASEMVTNAVRHGSPPVMLGVASNDDTVVVAVGDGSGQAPMPRTADADAEGGRGMALVDLLASDHGVWSEPPGKTVWAAVRRPH
jgi:anti-sigma regulatory factor (Ser/Thr protein kinase)/anti-anti-sigma regulatory factor